jgi:hypothetical protein
MSPAIVRTIWRPIHGTRAVGPSRASRGAARARGLLEQRDAMAVVRQQQRRGAARRAGADDRDATHG